MEDHQALVGPVRRDESRRCKHECLRHIPWRRLSACRVRTRADVSGRTVIPES